MPTVRIVTEADLRAAVALDADAVACVEQAFLALAGGGVVMPPILRLDIQDSNGEVDVKTAYVPGLDSFAIKISPGFFDNPALGLPSVNGLMTLFSAKTGLLEAVLLDNGYLTDVRTAAAGAVAAKHLSRPDARRAAVFGAGVQARLQLEALALVRPLEAATVWARNADKAAACAADLTARLGIPVTTAASAEDAVAEADVIVLTTPSTTPLLRAEWLRPGQHVTAMGSDAEHKNELDPAVLARPDVVYVADSLAQTRRLGELHHAIEAGVVAADIPFAELGAVAAGAAPGRTDADQITVADLTGTGVQDTAIATLARTRVVQADAGQAFES
ncbi:cyclodeaminase [Roseospira marina]|uniref:Cyclodeaminase n=1 Tax=Roseospira marina TaxID=140057 RepID=A0A5M6I757_9PROT|nr:cyclodeaminase [Roseospira marina]KAA5604104.1 cyclodeaminase [Roseospira marina]MBB4315796.1 ornithine cyclodeaminase [Roseospira marina]MBB5088965.1 ornithine cyclodeaminase [Roseospira marina]